MSDGQSRAEAIEASDAREDRARGDLAQRAYRKYGGLRDQPTSEDYWREASGFTTDDLLANEALFASGLRNGITSIAAVICAATGQEQHHRCRFDHSIHWFPHVSCRPRPGRSRPR